MTSKLQAFWIALFVTLGIYFIRCGSGLLPLNQRPTPWYDTAWAYRMKLSFQTQTISTAEDNIPVATILNSSRIDFSKTQNAGQDLRFTDCDGLTLLSYEIEKFDEVGDQVVWVKVPHVDASSTTDCIYLYYGNASAADAQSASQVWSNQFAGIWHFQNQLTDSSSHVSNTPTSTATSFVTGKMAQGVSLNGTSSYVDLVNGGTDLNFLQNVTAITVSAWGKITSVDATEKYTVFSLSDDTSTTERLRFYLEESGGTAQTKSLLLANTSTVRTDSASSNISAGTWNFVTTTIQIASGAGGFGFYSSESALSPLSNTVFDATSSSTSSGVSRYAIIGRRTTAADYFDGVIDELQVSSTVRSQSWIQMTFRSMTDTLISYGSEETP